MVGLASLALSSFIFSLSAAAASLPQLDKRDGVPPFVLQYAPVSHLFSGEKYLPSDISEHLTHVVPEINFTITAPSVTLQNISRLTNDVFLTSKDDVTKIPAWLTSEVGKPDASGFSYAPVTIVLVEKSFSVLDAFFFYFYSYDNGGTVIDIPFGDHVGDWEHNMIRFVNGEPTVVYFSAHTGGNAYTIEAVELTDGRPTNYIADGTHANYAVPGEHCHDLPGDLLCDQTDAGPLWDPAQNFRAFWYNATTSIFSVAGGAGPGAQELGSEGADWLNFTGQWGDEQYRILEHGQYCIPLPNEDECRYVSGPTGPIAKNLPRKAPCQREDGCTIATSL